MDKLAWNDVEDIAVELAERHPKMNPLSVRFTELRKLVEALPNFEPEPGRQVNEQILEAIQSAWHEEHEDLHSDDEDDDDTTGYTPVVPFKPQD